jgi:hypothetical protein
MSSTPSAPSLEPASALEALLHRLGERRGVDVEAKLDRGRDLVDVLAAWPRRADEPLFELALVDLDGRRDLDHDCTSAPR